ncbi:MAG: Hsp20/alpha crystallin family protein [Candidatus Acidiferrales bacterium]
MSLPRFAAKYWNGRHLTIRRVTPEERAGIVQDAIAKKVSQNVKSLGFEPGHELKDWREAESEILHPLNCGFLVLDNRVEVNTDAASFGEGEIQICVEPQHLMICGKDRINTPEIASKSADQLVIRALELPLEIEPSAVTAGFRGRTIEIDLPKACSKNKAAANAAA